MPCRHSRPRCGRDRNAGCRGAERAGCVWVRSCGIRHWCGLLRVGCLGRHVGRVLAHEGCPPRQHRTGSDHPRDRCRSPQRRGAGLRRVHHDTRGERQGQGHRGIARHTFARRARRPAARRCTGDSRTTRRYGRDQPRGVHRAAGRRHDRAAPPTPRRRRCVRHRARHLPRPGGRGARCRQPSARRDGALIHGR